MNPILSSFNLSSHFLSYDVTTQFKQQEKQEEIFVLFVCH